MKIAGVLFVALVGVGGCASAPSAPLAVAEAPCQRFQSTDREEATQNFGSCLALADGLAAARKPTAAPPEATHWNMPVMQSFVAGTTHGAAGAAGAAGG